MSDPYYMFRFLAEDMREKYIVEKQKWKEELVKRGFKRVYAVHELCECSMKRKLRREFPDLEIANIYNPRILLGEIVHRGMAAITSLPCEHKVNKVIKVDGEDVIIGGSIDFYDKVTNTIYEIKYTTSIDHAPYEHHILQVKLYKWLCDTDEAYIIYISPGGIKAYKVDETIDEEGVKELVKSEATPRWSWECKYCIYKPFCPVVNNMLEEQT